MKHRGLVVIVVSATTVFSGTQSWSYPEKTHQFLSVAAASGSVLASSTVLADVGLAPLGSASP